MCNEGEKKMRVECSFNNYVILSKENICNDHFSLRKNNVIGGFQ